MKKIKLDKDLFIHSKHHCFEHCTVQICVTLCIVQICVQCTLCKVRTPAYTVSLCWTEDDYKCRLIAVSFRSQAIDQ